MKKLLLISLVIFFTICSRSWALPFCPGSPQTEGLHNWTNCLGTYTFSNGDTYVGEWKDGKMHGKGSLKSAKEQFIYDPVYILFLVFFVIMIIAYRIMDKSEKKAKRKAEQKEKEIALEEKSKAAKELLHKAENGDHKLALELSKKNKENNVEAFYWNLIAEASGNKEAITNKANILNEMSDLQINIAQERFKKWLNNKIGINVSNNYAPFKTQSSFGGYVYIMTCDKWIEDGLVKIGKSNNIERRLNEAQKEVQGTYSPNPPIIKVYHHQFSRHYDELEKYIHMKLENRKFRSDTSTATEFFRLTPEEAKAELDIAIREIEEKMTS